MTICSLAAKRVVAGHLRPRRLAAALALTFCVSVAVIPATAAARELSVITYAGVTHAKGTPPITVVTLTNRTTTVVTAIETHVALGYGLPEAVLPASACNTHSEKFLCTLSVAPGASTTICVEGSELPAREGLYVRYANGTSEINEPELKEPVSSCPLGSFGTARCIVPTVKGKKLGPASIALKSAHCALGRITKAHSRHVKKGLVISQSPAAGRSLPSGAKVNLTLSKGG